MRREPHMGRTHARLGDRPGLHRRDGNSYGGEVPELDLRVPASLLAVRRVDVLRL